MTNKLAIGSLVAVCALPGIVLAQDHPKMPAGMTHEQHQAQMKKEAELKEHGQMAMGFDQAGTRPVDSCAWVTVDGEALNPVTGQQKS